MPRGVHPNSRANLRPRWKPGEPGNPQGKQGITLRAFILDFMAQRGEGETEQDRKAALVRRMYDLAMAGNAQLLIELLERMEPKKLIHELEAAGMPSRLVIEWKGGDRGEGEGPGDE